MPTKADLTSADLTEIRQAALGAADPLGIAADLADAAETGRLADPDDAGHALTLAAEIAESRSKLDAALGYAERAIASYATPDDTKAGAAHALHARLLFRSGRDDEALAELEPLRPLLTEVPDAAAYITAALAAGGRSRVIIAEQWLTEAVKKALAGRATEPSSADDAGLTFFLLQQRHRVRHTLGLPHDANDNLADRLENKLAATTARAAAEPADDLLFWPQAEFDRMLTTWPALAQPYGATWDDHRAHLERELVRLTSAGRTGLTLLPATVTGLTGFAGTDNDPADPKTRAGYANQQATRAGQITWPPERNGACWCGSGNKYKKCCLPRSR
ncbi:SEC-C domain-containing protein [Winogradskya consettensis]|uniref:Preprotein translocase SecA n=1 Tax=Winogradskya consettensis TaxID=113560 RepID=A0A919VV19_9ACTN|nr:SEC-C domain-containing protein [Actinoplanes consettensis]GIM70468.1 preprotein translocase SecA [Actinoplanes consettensis]